MPHTFKVDAVSLNKKNLPTDANVQAMWCSATNTPQPMFYQCNTSAHPLIATTETKEVCNQFVRAVHLAYAHHYPLSLSPDHLWTQITQQLAFHVNANAEKLRSKFVTHEGKKTLTLAIPASPDWGTVVAGFSNLIKPLIGEQTHDTLVANFSTTTATERICSEIVLMDTLKQYFDYHCYTDCGIVSVTLEGTPEDWEELRQRAAGLVKYDLDWWIPKYLIPILDEFVLAAHGKPNVAFWQNMYKIHGGSGGPWVSGWITDLFAYLRENHRNDDLGFYNSEKEQRWGTPFQPNTFGGTINQCPGTWDLLGNWKYIKFCAGFIGCTQDANSKTIRPELGWAVMETTAPNAANTTTSNQCNLQ